MFTLKDRIGLVHDAFALARAGFSDVSSALTLVEILKNEKECEHPRLLLYGLPLMIFSSPGMGQHV